MDKGGSEKYEFLKELAVTFIQEFGSSFIRLFVVVAYILYFLNTLIPATSGLMIWLVFLLSTAGLWWGIEFALKLLKNNL